MYFGNLSSLGGLGGNTNSYDFLGNGFGTSNNTGYTNLNYNSLYGDTSNGFNGLTNNFNPYNTNTNNNFFNSNKNTFGNENNENTLGMNLNTFKFGLGALTGLGQLYGGFKAASIANSQFDYAKKISDLNIANQTKAYNTNLSDRATARYATENKSSGELNNYIKKNSL